MSWPLALGLMYPFIPSAGTYTVAFDTSGRVSTLTQVSSGVTSTYTYGYDSVGRISTVSFSAPTKSAVITYSYNAAGQITGLVVA